MTAIPAYTKTWTQNLTLGVPGTRIAYSSVLDTCQKYAYGVKAFLVTGGLSVVWSASGGTGPTNAADHTDRITSSATWTPRAVGAAASQAWVVLLDGNGGHLLLAFTGGSDDIFYVAYSPSAAYALAGTTNNRPTATDEIVLSSATTMVNATASADRVWHGLISSDAKNYRFCIARSNVLTAQAWGVDAITVTTAIGASTTFPNNACVWSYPITSLESAASLYGAANTNARFQMRVVIASVGFTASMGASSYAFNGSNPGFITYQPEIQGASSGYPPFPIFLWSPTASCRGYMGTLIDLYACAASASVSGEGFGGSYEWWQLGYTIWPNPSNVAPALT